MSHALNINDLGSHSQTPANIALESLPNYPPPNKIIHGTVNKVEYYLSAKSLLAYYVE